MKIYLIALLSSLGLSTLLGIFTIPLLKRIRIGQPILKYVESHKEKNGTPTMGGLFFIASACIIFVIFGGVKGKLSLIAMVVGLAFLLVGFIDDFIKVKSKNNQGLKAYQKIGFLTSISLFSGLFAYRNNLTRFLLPFSLTIIDLGVWTIPFIALIFIAITNSVNLTDGLDGLAGNVSVAYLVFMAILILLEINMQEFFVAKDELYGLLLLTIALIGALIGFLLFNTNKASVFMGDTGSLSLGGFIGVISIFSANSFFVPIIGLHNLYPKATRATDCKKTFLHYMKSIQVYQMGFVDRYEVSLYPLTIR